VFQKRFQVLNKMNCILLMPQGNWIKDWPSPGSSFKMVIVEKGAGSELVRDINFSLPASKAGRVFIGVVFSQQIHDRFFFNRPRNLMQHCTLWKYGPWDKSRNILVFLLLKRNTFLLSIYDLAKHDKKQVCLSSWLVLILKILFFICLIWISSTK
jgi:hypothetical protein